MKAISATMTPVRRAPAAAVSSQLPGGWLSSLPFNPQFTASTAGQDKQTRRCEPAREDRLR